MAASLNKQPLTAIQMVEAYKYIYRHEKRVGHYKQLSKNERLIIQYAFKEPTPGEDEIETATQRYENKYIQEGHKIFRHAITERLHPYHFSTSYILVAFMHKYRKKYTVRKMLRKIYNVKKPKKKHFRYLLNRLMLPYKGKYARNRNNYPRPFMRTEIRNLWSRLGGRRGLLEMKAILQNPEDFKLTKLTNAHYSSMKTILKRQIQKAPWPRLVPRSLFLYDRRPILGTKLNDQEINDLQREINEHEADETEEESKRERDRGRYLLWVSSRQYKSLKSVNLQQINRARNTC